MNNVMLPDEDRLGYIRHPEPDLSLSPHSLAGDDPEKMRREMATYFAGRLMLDEKYRGSDGRLYTAWIAKNAIDLADEVSRQLGK